MNNLTRLLLSIFNDNVFDLEKNLKQLSTPNKIIHWFGSGSNGKSTVARLHYLAMGNCQVLPSEFYGCVPNNTTKFIIINDININYLKSHINYLLELKKNRTILIITNVDFNSKFIDFKYTFTNRFVSTPNVNKGEYTRRDIDLNKYTDIYLSRVDI